MIPLGFATLFECQAMLNSTTVHMMDMPITWQILERSGIGPSIAGAC